MLLCHVHLWSSAWHKTLSAQMNLWTKTDVHTKRFCWLLSQETRWRETWTNMVFWTVEETWVTWTHPGSNKQMRRPWYECTTTQWITLFIHTWTNMDHLATPTHAFFYSSSRCVYIIAMYEYIFSMSTYCIACTHFTNILITLPDPYYNLKIKWKTYFFDWEIEIT